MPTHHWIIPFAACECTPWDEQISQVNPDSFARLNKLLASMKLAHTDKDSAQSLSTPQERVLARAQGLQVVDGLIPWAAWTRQQLGANPAGKAWAFIDLCHWTIERASARMADPSSLDLSPTQSHELMAIMQPYFATHGITLHYHEPTRWFAEGEVFRNLPTASLERVIGRDVQDWLPHGDAGKPLRVLQNEMQMLLYTHPFTQMREQPGRPSVNSFWVSGTGALPAAKSDHVVQEMVPRVLTRLVLSPLVPKTPAKLDPTDYDDLWRAQKQGEVVRVSVCGDHAALTFETERGGLLAKLGKRFATKPLLGLLEQL